MWLVLRRKIKISVEKGANLNLELLTLKFKKILFNIIFFKKLNFPRRVCNFMANKFPFGSTRKIEGFMRDTGKNCQKFRVFGEN